MVLPKVAAWLAFKLWGVLLPALTLTSTNDTRNKLAVVDCSYGWLKGKHWKLTFGTKQAVIASINGVIDSGAVVVVSASNHSDDPDTVHGGDACDYFRQGLEKLLQLVPRTRETTACMAIIIMEAVLIYSLQV